MTNHRRPDPFEAYAALPAPYHKDPRWKEVRRLRAANQPGDQIKANGLVLQIRADYHFEG